ncbi:16S rRNA (guanine(966)-N(2))-methyltransferase RsmD [Desulfonatronum parangueonense]
MRIIAGHWKGRRIKTTEGEGYRPAMGRVREAVFSMLSSRGVQWEDARVLDVFAGSGSLGWEALSRGAREVCFIESNPKALHLLREQASSFSRPGQIVRVLPGDALRILAAPPKSSDKRAFRYSDDGPTGEARPDQGYDVLFFDPPYGRDFLGQAIALAHANGWVAPEALVCVEVEADADVTQIKLPEYELETDRLYGQTRIILWKKIIARNGSPSIPAPSIP